MSWYPVNLCLSHPQVPETWEDVLAPPGEEPPDAWDDDSDDEGGEDGTDHADADADSDAAADASADASADVDAEGAGAGAGADDAVVADEAEPAMPMEDVL